MQLDLTGRKALITGGSGEIGRALCGALAAAGVDVMFTFFSNHEGAAETTAAIEAHGRKAIAVRAHFGKEPSIDQVLAAAREQLGQVDIFVHNAASGVLKPAAELSRRHWDWTHQINARAFFFLVQGLFTGEAPLMGSGGRVLALSSLGAVKAIPQYAAVGTSKAALEAAVRHLSIELGAKGISANVVAPGVIDTWSLQQFPNREDLLRIATLRTPMGRLTTPDDVAQKVLFLCTSGAAMIHGQTINIDGGYSSMG